VCAHECAFNLLLIDTAYSLTTAQHRGVVNPSVSTGPFVARQRGIKGVRTNRQFCLTSGLTLLCAMIQLETPNSYYSREGLLRFLRRTFGNLNFKVTPVNDAYFTFKAPRALTSVSAPNTQG
jgi:hypothetical protein